MLCIAYRLSYILDAESEKYLGQGLGNFQLSSCTVFNLFSHHSFTKTKEIKVIGFKMIKKLGFQVHSKYFQFRSELYRTK